MKTAPFVELAVFLLAGEEEQADVLFARHSDKRIDQYFTEALVAEFGGDNDAADFCLGNLEPDKAAVIALELVERVQQVKRVQDEGGAGEVAVKAA